MYGQHAQRGRGNLILTTLHVIDNLGAHCPGPNPGQTTGRKRSFTVPASCTINTVRRNPISEIVRRRCSKNSSVRSSGICKFVDNYILCCTLFTHIGSFAIGLAFCMSTFSIILLYLLPLCYCTLLTAYLVPSLTTTKNSPFRILQCILRVEWKGRICEQYNTIQCPVGWMLSAKENTQVIITAFLKALKQAAVLTYDPTHLCKYGFVWSLNAWQRTLWSHQSYTAFTT